MPYDMDSENLPKHVKDMPEEKRKQWIETFNSAYEDCTDDEGDPSDCDGEAMRIANASVSDRVRRWFNKLLSALGFGVERKIVEVEEWDGSASNYPDTDAYCSACLIDVNSAAGKDPKVQGYCMLPIRRPEDPAGTYVKQAVHAAAGGHGITQVVKPDGVSTEDWDAAVKVAANKLVTAYGEMDEECPESVLKMAGKSRAVSLGGVIDQVYSKLAESLQDEYVWVNDVYLDGDGTFLLCSSKGKLYRFRIEVSADNLVSLGAGEEVVMDIQPSTSQEPGSQEEPGSDSDYDEFGSIQLSRFMPNNMVIRQEGERYRWLSVSCVSVLNRAGEIDSSALFDSFVEYAERTGEYPIRQFYHAGEIFRTGKADFLARVGYALITSGLYDDTDLARAEVAARQNEPAFWGDSIGFVAEFPEMWEVQSGISVPVYKSGTLREISTLPEAEACAWFTNLTNVEVSRMNNRQFEAFVKLFGGDEEKAKKWLEDNPEALNRQIVDGGMLARSTETVEVDLTTLTDNQIDNLANGTSIQDVIANPDMPVPERAVELDDASMQILVDRAVEQMQGNLVPLAEGLQTIQTNWDASMAELTRKLEEYNTALQAHASRLSSLEADKAETDRTKVLDMPKSSLKVTYRPRNGGAIPEEVEKPADKAKVTLSKIKDAY